VASLSTSVLDATVLTGGIREIPKSVLWREF
jgi:hypothetical protein